MASFGEDLKRERELRDISLEEISGATNISRAFLEALEQNNFDVLPGGAYSRGFIRSYARHLGIDVDKTLDAFRAELERRHAAAEGAARQPLVRAQSTHGGKAAEVVVAGAMVLTALLTGLIFWSGSTSDSTAAVPDPEAHEAALRARFKKAGSLPPLPGTPGEEGPEGLARAQSASAEAAEPAEPEAPEVLVRLRARETTGVQLSCGGRLQFDGELWVGAERHFPCRGSIFVSAGNAGALDVAVGGEDLHPLGRPGERVMGREISGSGGPAPPGGERETASTDGR